MGSSIALISIVDKSDPQNPQTVKIPKYVSNMQTPITREESWLREEKTNYLLYENLMVLHLNKLESPLPKDALFQFGLNWPSGSGEFVNVFSLFRNYLPLKRMWGPSFEQTWVLITQGYIVPSVVEVGPVFLEKKIFKFHQYIFAIS